MDKRQSSEVPERLRYSKYYEHDGALRAYANRMMWFGISAVMISFVLAVLFFWVRVQPPTVIRIAANGDATVVSGATTTPRTPLGFINALAAGSAPGEQPTDIEGRAVVRRFLESYLTYTPTTMEQNWANTLNLMTHNLRTVTLNQLRDQDIVSKVKDEQITSTFKLRSLESVKGQPWTYVAFGVKEVHSLHNKIESTDRLVARYNVRLLQTERSERVPSGLLVAEYGESQMVGEKDNNLVQSSVLIDDGKK
ncbi:MAG: hypothetical protein LAP87_18380 [Acidobacteriia bacterium]|nr:hypothetical protein [Terriglobia bacterium]